MKRISSSLLALSFISTASAQTDRLPEPSFFQGTLGFVIILVGLLWLIVSILLPFVIYSISNSTRKTAVQAKRSADLLEQKLDNIYHLLWKIREDGKGKTAPLDD